MHNASGSQPHKTIYSAADLELIAKRGLRAGQYSYALDLSGPRERQPGVKLIPSEVSILKHPSPTDEDVDDSDASIEPTKVDDASVKSDTVPDHHVRGSYDPRTRGPPPTQEDWDEFYRLMVEAVEMSWIPFPDDSAPSIVASGDHEPLDLDHSFTRPESDPEASQSSPGATGKGSVAAQYAAEAEPGQEVADRLNGDGVQADPRPTGSPGHLVVRAHDNAEDHLGGERGAGVSMVDLESPGEEHDRNECCRDMK